MWGECGGDGGRLRGIICIICIILKIENSGSHRIAVSVSCVFCIVWGECRGDGGAVAGNYMYHMEILV